MSESDHIIGVLPARWGSTRFPGKAIHPIAGKPLIRHVWERCQSCHRLHRVIVATDDERIREVVTGFGGEVVMTRDDHPSGTDRIAEVAQQVPQATHLINIQGDEPLISPGLIDSLARELSETPGLDMITAANPLEPGDPAVGDPNVVKVTIDQSGMALYFSRSPIPFVREPVEDLVFLRHKGIYGFSRAGLLRFVSFQPSTLERTECLEQLRALENGMGIRVVLTDDASPGVDTPEQASNLEREMLNIE